VDGFSCAGVSGWSTKHTTKLYVSDAAWPAPSWFTRVADNVDRLIVDVVVAADEAACQVKCSQQHTLHVAFPDLEVDCTQISFQQEQREGITGTQCYLQVQTVALRPSLCADFGQVLGGYSVLGGGTAVHKTFDLSVYPHDEVTVSLDFVKIDSWNGQNATLYIDGQPAWSRGFGPSDGDDICGNPSGTAGSSGEVKVAVGPIVLSHSTAALEMRIEMDAHESTDSGWASFAIDNVRVLPQLRWSAACDRATYKGSTGNDACTPCPSNSRAVDRGSLDVTSCLCDADYTGIIEVATDRCSPLPRTMAVSGGANAPTVSVAWQPLGDRPPNFNERLVIIGNVSSSSSGELVWTAARLGGGPLELDGAASTPTSSALQIGTDQAVPLVIPANTLSQAADGSGNFAFRLTASAGELTSYAEVVVAMNSPPSQGWLQALPANGTAVTTTFSLSAVGWTDADLPLTYRLFTLDGTGNRVVLAEASGNNQMSTVLSAGAAAEGHKIGFGATITDAFGGSTTATNETVVMPYVPPTDPVAAMDQAQDLLTGASSDTFAVQRLASALSSSMGTERSEAAVEMRTLLVASLATSISSMSNGSAAWTPDVVSGMLIRMPCTLAHTPLTADADCVVCMQVALVQFRPSHPAPTR
jgi:hypothetical protein